MIDVRLLRPLAKSIDARREAQRHLDCLTRQIAARAGRQATTVKVRSRARRRSSPRLYHRELFDRFAFERWVELDTIVCSLATQEQSSGRSSIATASLCFIRRNGRTRGERTWRCPTRLRCHRHGGLGHVCRLPWE